jgi:hypothetical protein
MSRVAKSVAGTALALFVLAAALRAQEAPLALDKVPRPVLDAAKKRFPKAEVKGASKEGEGDKMVYEVTLKQDGKNIDVTLTPGGKITLIEKELAFKDLPKPVAGTLTKKYPNARYAIIEEVIKVEGGKETIEYYEAHLTTADKKTMEAEVFPDGKLKGETEAKEEKKDK